MIRRIHVDYELVVEPDVDEAVIERVHAFHADHCPVARSVRDAIAITTAYTLVRR